MAIIELARGAFQGTYLFKIEETDEKFGPSGFPYIILTLRCLDENHRGQTVRTNLSLSPNARFRVDSFLDAIKAPMTGKMTSDDFRGKYLYCTLEIKPDQNGNDRSEVTGYAPVPEGQTVPEEEKEEESSEANIIKELDEELTQLPF